MLGDANNGTTLAALNLIGFLKKRGHEVTVVSPDTDRGDGFVSVPPINLGPLLNGILRRNGVCPAKPKASVIEPAVRDADIVHLLLPFPLSICALRYAGKYSKPVTASFHCQAENVTAHLGMMDMSHVNKLIYRMFYRFVYSHCDAVHYPTEFIREVFEGTCAPTNAYVISNGVNDIFKISDSPRKAESDRFTVLCCGRYSKEKAQYQLINAAAESKYKDRLHLIFAGDGPDKKKLMSLAKERGVDCEFRFFKRENLVRTMQSADLYVHTAVVEIEAIACMEAICCGLVPVICNSERSATRFFSMEEKNLFEINDFSDLAAKIDYWYEHPEEKAECSRLYAPMRASLSQERCMMLMEDMIKETLDGYEEEHLLQRSAE